MKPGSAASVALHINNLEWNRRRRQEKNVTNRRCTSRSREIHKKGEEIDVRVDEGISSGGRRNKSESTNEVEKNNAAPRGRSFSSIASLDSLQDREMGRIEFIRDLKVSNSVEWAQILEKKIEHLFNLLCSSDLQQQHIHDSDQGQRTMNINQLRRLSLASSTNLCSVPAAESEMARIAHTPGALSCDCDTFKIYVESRLIHTGEHATAIVDQWIENINASELRSATKILTNVVGGCEKSKKKVRRTGIGSWFSIGKRTKKKNQDGHGATKTKSAETAAESLRSASSDRSRRGPFEDDI